MSIRPILEARIATPTLEGAGVHLHCAFGFHDPSELDPFLLFDDFRNEDGRRSQHSRHVGQPHPDPLWHGPVVMNTRDEIRQAVKDLQNGTFIKPAH